jgi:hypothetical protein
MLTKDEVLEIAKEALAGIGVHDAVEADHFAAMYAAVRAKEPETDGVQQAKDVVGVFHFVPPPPDKEAELRAILEQRFKPQPPAP